MAEDNTVEIIPHCAACRVKLINTRFADGVMRHICPVCKGKCFTKMDGGWVKAKGYSEFDEPFTFLKIDP